MGASGRGDARTAPPRPAPRRAPPRRPAARPRGRGREARARGATTTATATVVVVGALAAFAALLGRARAQPATGARPPPPVANPPAHQPIKRARAALEDLLLPPALLAELQVRGGAQGRLLLPQRAQQDALARGVDRAVLDGEEVELRPSIGSPPSPSGNPGRPG